MEKCEVHQKEKVAVCGEFRCGMCYIEMVEAENAEAPKRAGKEIVGVDGHGHFVYVE